MLYLIQQQTLLTTPNEAKWNSILTELLPTRVNLDKRGIELHSSPCLVYDEAQENEHHLFAECFVVVELQRYVINWWALNPTVTMNLSSAINFADSVNGSGIIPECLDVVSNSLMWILWKHQSHIEHQKIEYQHPWRRFETLIIPLDNK